MTGGTDQDCGESYYPAQLLARADLVDARYALRAWAQGLAWSTIIAGAGMVITGLAQYDTALLCSGVTAVVVAFIPRARPVWVYEVARTWAMKQGWAAVPAEERPFRTGGNALYKHFPVLPERERPN